MKKRKSKYIIKESFLDIFRVWSIEIKNILKDPGVLIFFIVVPLAYPLLYAFIYTNETVREVPIVAVDASHTTKSREFLRKVDACADVQIVAHSSDMEEAKQIMREKNAYGSIYIPAEFNDKLVKGEQAYISIFCDMSGLLYYKAILSACTDVSLKMNQNLKIERMRNSTDRQDKVSTQPIEYEYITLFNSQNGFASFLIPAVLMLIIQQTLLLGVGMSTGTWREQNRFLELDPISRHCHGSLRIVLGKSLTYLMIYMLMGCYIACVVPQLFSLVQIPHSITLVSFMLPYLLACIFFSMTASILVRNRETCMLIFVFSSVPLLFISGISWPGVSIPIFWKVFSWIFPSTFGINGFVHINTMGATLNEISTEIYALWSQTGVYFLSTCLVYRYQILRSKKTHIIELKKQRSVR